MLCIFKLLLGDTKDTNMHMIHPCDFIQVKFKTLSLQYCCNMQWKAVSNEIRNLQRKQKKRDY